MLCRVTHMTILPVVFCVMNVGNHACQPSVTRSCPYGDCASKFVYCPQDVWSTNSSQVQAFQDDLRTYIGQLILQLFLKLWSSKQDVETVCGCSVFLFASSQCLSTHFWACPSMSQDHATDFAWGFSLPGNFSVAVAEIRDSNISLYCSMMISFSLHSRWVHPKYTWSRSEVGSSRSTFFIKFFHMGAIFCFLSSHFLMSSTHTDKKNPCFRWTRRHSQLCTFSHPSPSRNSSNCLSHKGPASGCPYKCRSRGTTESSTLVHDWGHLCRGRRIHISIWTFWRRNSEQSWNVLHFYLGVSWYCVGGLSSASS